MRLEQVTPGQRFSLFIVVLAAIMSFPRLSAAVPLVGQPTGITGMNPRLVPSRNDPALYLFAASTAASVLRFDMATTQWEGGIPDVPGMDNVVLMLASCWNGSCWGGPTFAADGDEVLHVVWGDRGWNDCNPASPFNTSVRLLHVTFDGSWSSPSTIIERTAGSAQCGYQYPALAEDGSGNLALVYQSATWLHDDVYEEGTAYQHRPASTGVWSASTPLGNFKAGPRASGGFGRLFLGFANVGQGRVAEIDPATGSVLSDEQIMSNHVVPSLFLSGADELHAWLVAWVGDPNWHADKLYYDRREASGWESAQSQLVLDDPSIFVTPQSGEEDSVVDVAAAPSGRRLMTFTYMRRLWALSFDGSAWGPPVELETGDDVWSAATKALDDGRYLIVWSTGMNGTADVKWALYSDDPCAACGDNEVCQGGACVCATPLCSGLCCELGELCISSACTTATFDGGTMDDAFVSDGATSGDGSLTPDASPGSGDAKGGCSCQSMSSSGGASAPLVMLLFFALALVRRRPRS